MLSCTYLVLIASGACPALNRLHSSIWLDWLNTRLGLNIQALPRTILDSNVKVVGNEEVLSGSIIDTRVDSDDASVGRVVAEVHARCGVGSCVDDPDLGGTKVVVEELSIARASRAVVLSWTQVEAVSAGWQRSVKRVQIVV